MEALLLAADKTSAQGGSNWIMIVWLVLLVAMFYFLLIRPQKKQKKAEQELRDSITIGDEIVTIGGFYGKIVAVKDDSYIIESTVDHSKQRILKTAVQTNNTVHAEAAAAEKKDDKKAEKKAKKADK